MPTRAQHKTVDLIFLFSIIYIGLACFSYIFSANSCLKLYDFSYFIPVFISPFALLYLRNKNQDHFQLRSLFVQRKFLLAFIPIFTLLALAIYFLRLQFLYDHPLWLDEYIQAFAQESYRQCNLVSVAALQQQPPTDYILHHFAIQLFGPSIFAIRFNSMLFSTASVFVFFLFLIRLKIKYYLIPAVLVLFLTQPLLFIYSFEARPISLSIFYLLIYLWYFLDLFQELKPQRGFLYFSLVFYLLSIGLQPTFICICLTLSVILLTQKRYRVKSLLWQTSFAFLTVSPVFYRVYTSSQSTHKLFDKTVSGNLSKFFSSFFQFKNLDLNFYLEPFHNLIFFSLCICFALLYQSLFHFKDLRKKSKKHRVFLCGFFFYLSFIWLFKTTWSLINWHIYTKYIINSYPVVLLFFISWGSSFVFTNKRIFQFIISFIFLVSSFQFLRHFEKGFGTPPIIQHSQSIHTDWRAFFREIEKDPYPIFLSSIPYSLVGYSSLRIPPHQIFISEKKEIHNCATYKENCFIHAHKSSSIYLIINYRLTDGLSESVFKKVQELRNKYKVLEFNKLFVINLPPGKAPIPRVEQALVELTQVDPYGEQNINILHLLLQHYLSERKVEKAKWAIQRIKKLKLRKMLGAHFNFRNQNTKYEEKLKKAELQLKSLEEKN